MRSSARHNIGRPLPLGDRPIWPALAKGLGCCLLLSQLLALVISGSRDVPIGQLDATGQ
jgi:hypothetical protein